MKPAAIDASMHSTPPQRAAKIAGGSILFKTECLMALGVERRESVTGLVQTREVLDREILSHRQEKFVWNVEHAHILAREWCWDCQLSAIF